MAAILEIICQAAPDRRNEDAFVAYQRDAGQPQYVMAAIDGATSVVTYAPLQFHLDQYRNGITPAALAASVTRNAILTALGNADSNDDIDPRQLILDANTQLRALLDDVSPEIFDAAAIVRVQPQHAALLDDPRKMRLFLPSAVITLATVDTAHQLLRYAHAGDTALLVCYDDGRVEVPTHHERRIMNYESALAVASQTVRKTGTPMNAVLDDPLVRTLDLNQRIYHNFVDEDGNTQPERGIGVVDGLPELADYITTGLLPLTGVRAVIAISDGFWWPAPLHETRYDRQQRIRNMWQHIQADGLRGYFAALRHEERLDANREKYPRFKLHDDATAVVLWLSE